MSDVDDFEAAGLYDPDATDAPLRLEVLRFFTDDVGASIPEIVQALEEDRLLSMAAFRTIRPGGQRLTLTQIAERAGRQCHAGGAGLARGRVPRPPPVRAPLRRRRRHVPRDDPHRVRARRRGLDAAARAHAGLRVRPGRGSGDRAAAVTHGGAAVRGREVRRSRAQLPATPRKRCSRASSTRSTHCTATRSKPSAAGTPVPARRSRTSFRSRSGSPT